MGSSSTGGFGNSFNFPSFPSGSANQTPTLFPGGFPQASSSNPFGSPSVASPFASSTLGSNPTPHTTAFGFPTPTSSGFANQRSLFGGFTGDGGAQSQMTSNTLSNNSPFLAPSKTPTWGSSGAWGTSGAIPPSPFGATSFNTTSSTSWPSAGCDSFGKKPTANFGFPTPLHTNNSGKENPFSASLFSSKPGGSRTATYTASKVDGDSYEKLVSISAMPVYDAKSHEELKWEDYQLRIQGGPSPSVIQTPFPGSQPTGTSTPLTNPFPSPGLQHTGINTTPFTNPFPFPGSQPTGTSTTPSTNSFPFPASQPTGVFATPSTNPFPFPGSQPSTNPFPFPGSQPSTNPFPFPGSQPSTTPSTNPFPFPGSQPSATPSTNPFPFPGSQPSATSSTNPFPFPGSQPSTTNPFPFPGSQPSTTPLTNPFPFPGSQPSTTPLTNPFPFPGSQPSTTPSTNPFPFPGSQPSTTPLTNPFPFPGSQPTTTPSTNPFPFPGSQPTGMHHVCTACGCMKKNDFTSQVQGTAESSQIESADPAGNSKNIVPVKDPFGVESSKSQLLAPPKVGISSMPVVDKPSPSRVSPLLTLRHVSQGRTTLQLNIWKPKSDVKKVPFFNREDPHGIPRPVNHPIPRENPKSAFVKVAEPTNDAFNGIPSQLDDESAEPNENSADETNAHLGLSRNVTVEKQAPAAVPKLTHPEYYTKPLISELEIKESSDPGFCGRVRGFVIGRHGYGKVEFEGETDVRGLDLDSLVEFNVREVAVYKDESNKVAVGEGLNKPALVTLLNVKCLNKKTQEIYVAGDEVAKYTDMLRTAAQRQGAQFVSFDAAKGEWKFHVDHF